MATATIRRMVISAALAVTAVAGIPAAASAATVTYTNATAFSVPNNTGIAGIDLVVSVPTGRPDVQKIEVPMRPSFPAGGGGDVSYKLRAPDATEMFVMLNGCPAFPNTSDFTISDEAAFPVGVINFCVAEPNGGTGRPDDPDGKKLSIFNGRPSGGVWALNVRDIGLNATQGTLNSWGVKITHEPLTITGKGKKQRIKKSAKVKLTCNADCTVTGGGDATGRSFELDQNETDQVAFPLKRKALKRVADGGKLKLKLNVTDEIGDVVKTTVKVKTLG